LVVVEESFAAEVNDCRRGMKLCGRIWLLFMEEELSILHDCILRWFKARFVRCVAGMEILRDEGKYSRWLFVRENGMRNRAFFS